MFFFFSSRRRHTRSLCDWSSDVCSSDLGARPTLTGFAPTVVGYGQTLQVDTPDGASIAKVTFIRTGSVTHAMDQAARLVPLTFAAVSGGISVTLPASRTTAPPGPYLLFLVNANGVPSVGRIMRLE